MEKKVACSNSRNTVRTDLSLLLECLKFQMKCPDLQKKALLAIHSICEKREDAVDTLREMGGVAFVYNLSKSSIVQSDVKETALFTLCTVAEANVYCKNSLCSRETFAQLAGLLMKEDITLTQKRVSVYLLSVLVSNNKSGQSLAQNTGCLDVLLCLFRATSPLSTNATTRTPTHTYQLWVSVSSALCGCVNNPQNEEGQRICVVVFPMIKTWLQQIALPRTEILQPICSFIAMTVANNSCVQESFSALGCLDSLSLALVRQALSANTSLLSCQLCVTLSKTLSACITDNALIASGLAHYGMVPHLLSVLTSPHLEPEDTLSILLALGHCTVASEEHQSQLVNCGGLPLIITLLTDNTSEEVRKAATFILQTCKQATLSLEVPSLIARQGQCENSELLTNMEGFRNSVKHLPHRIDLLEKRQAKEDYVEQEAADQAASSEGQVQPLIEARSNTIKLQTVKNSIQNDYDSKLKNVRRLSMQEEKSKTVCCSECKGTGAIVPFRQQPLEGDRQPHPADNQFFKPPAPLRHSSPKEMSCTKTRSHDHCMSTLEKIPVEDHSLSHVRCAGCVLSFEEVNSRTFTSLQRSYHHSCDMHQVLQEATARFRTRRCNLLLRREYQDNTVKHTKTDYETVSSAGPQRSWEERNKVSLTPKYKGAGNGKNFLPEHHWNKQNGFTLTPLYKGAKKDGSSLTPMKMSNLPGEEKLKEPKECRAAASVLTMQARAGSEQHSCV